MADYTPPLPERRAVTDVRVSPLGRTGRPKGATPPAIHSGPYGDYDPGQIAALAQAWFADYDRRVTALENDPVVSCLRPGLLKPFWSDGAHQTRQATLEASQELLDEWYAQARQARREARQAAFQSPPPAGEFRYDPDGPPEAIPAQEPFAVETIGAWAAGRQEPLGAPSATKDRPEGLDACLDALAAEIELTADEEALLAHPVRVIDRDAGALADPAEILALLERAGTEPPQEGDELPPAIPRQCGICGGRMSYASGCDRCGRTQAEVEESLANLRRTLGHRDPESGS